jgi:hypothetical protein
MTVTPGMQSTACSSQGCQSKYQKNWCALQNLLINHVSRMLHVFTPVFNKFKVCKMCLPIHPIHLEVTRHTRCYGIHSLLPRKHRHCELIVPTWNVTKLHFSADRIALHG